MEPHQLRHQQAQEQGLKRPEEDFLGQFRVSGAHPYSHDRAAVMGEFFYLHQERLHRRLCIPEDLPRPRPLARNVKAELIWMDYA